MSASSSNIVVGLNAVILCIDNGAPQALLAPTGPEQASMAYGDTAHALPFGPFDSMAHRSLDISLKTWVQTQTGLELGYVEQLYTFGNRFRSPDELGGGPRILSIGYMALMPPGTTPSRGKWSNLYAHLPWEDWRKGKPAIVETLIQPALETWAAELGPRAKKRVALAFGKHDPEMALERVELLYEAGLLPEAHRDLAAARQAGGDGTTDLPIRRANPDAPELADMAAQLGTPLIADHRRILATALSRLRGKIKYRPLVYELVPPTFTLLHLQQVVEALMGTPLHKPNFRRLVLSEGLVEETGEVDHPGRGRPASLYKFTGKALDSH